MSTDSLLFASPGSFALIHCQDSVIVKQLYWPVVTGSLFVITLYMFR